MQRIENKYRTSFVQFRNHTTDSVVIFFFIFDKLYVMDVIPQKLGISAVEIIF